MANSALAQSIAHYEFADDSLLAQTPALGKQSWYANDNSEKRWEDLRLQLEQRHPVHARILRHQLRVWAKISRDRERARSEVIRYFWVLRAYAIRAGELTGLEGVYEQGTNLHHALALAGRQKTREAAPPAPEQAIESTKEDVQWAKTRAKSASR